MSENSEIKNNITNDDLTELIDSETNKNKKKIKCLRCDSYILQPNSGMYTKLETSVSIPSMKQKKEIVNNLDSVEFEKLEHFWLVNDVYTFENVGFTNTIENKKYLICADCEIGPIGLQNLTNPNQFYLSLDRVKHV